MVASPGFRPRADFNGWKSMKYKVALLSPLGLLPFGGQPATAADMPVKAKAPQATEFTPNWAGLYAGVNLGVISDRSRQTGFPADPTSLNSYCFGGGDFGFGCSSSNSQTAVGVLGGAQIGYNFQNGKWVYGAELDFGLSSARKTVSAPNNRYAFIGNWTAKTGVEALGTARLRLGYAFDKALLYATGGLAYAKMVNAFSAGSTAGASYAFTDATWRAGYTVGGGLEYMVNRNWSVKAEGLYYDLGHKDITMAGAFSTNHSLTDRTTGVIGRIGLNYLFH